MTGENFKLINRKNTSIEKLNDELQNAKVTFTKYAKDADSDNWNWDQLHRLEQQVKTLEYKLDCLQYEDNRTRNW